MPAKPATVADYRTSLPTDRRSAIETVRATILKHLDQDFEEGIQYGMIGYYVPHRVYPAGYHCDPRQPLPFAALASQKNYMSLYLMCLYSVDYAESDLLQWFREEWAKTGKKLDMGKACVRFKKLDDIPLEVIAALFRRVKARTYIAACETALANYRSQKMAGSTRATADRRQKSDASAPPPKTRTRRKSPKS
ncbi:MAG: DUF1801 domain-containing protein [Planctomycetes bacterium]|nr:DUF1801 domain-containing protein [Planctomycetota bacterium]